MNRDWRSAAAIEHVQSYVATSFSSYLLSSIIIHLTSIENNFLTADPCHKPAEVIRSVMVYLSHNLILSSPGHMFV